MLLNLPGNLYLNLLEWQSKHQAEISGYGIVENGEVKHLWHTGKGSLGGVVTEAKDKADVLMQALVLGYNYLNLQWHTHFGMSAYFSLIDDNAQAKLVSVAKTQQEMYYLCVDQMELECRKFDIPAKSYVDGAVSVGGVTYPRGGSIHGFLTSDVIGTGFSFESFGPGDWSGEPWLEYDEYPSEDGSWEPADLRPRHSEGREPGTKLFWSRLAWRK